MAAHRWLISGRVQGVSYRWFTRQQAARLGLVGSVRNLTDGRVEVLVAGEPHKIEQLRVVLQDGPAAARVSSIDEMPMEESVQVDIATRSSFEITF